MMFADVEGIVTQALNIGDQIDIPVKGEGRVFRRMMRWHHEEGEFHGSFVVFGVVLTMSTCRRQYVDT